MRRLGILFTIVGFVLSASLVEAGMIRVDGVDDSTTINFTPGVDATVSVPLEITGGEMINNVTIGFGIGDNGPLFNGTETIHITAIDYVTNTIWPAGGITVTDPNPELPARGATVTGVTITSPSDGEVSANGLLVTLTLDVSSVTTDRGIIPINLDVGTDISKVRDKDNKPLTFTFDDSGGLQTVPEPSTFLLLGIGLLGMVALVWKNRRAVKA